MNDSSKVIEVTGEARGQLPVGTLVKHPGTGLLIRVETSRLAHGGWAEIDGTQHNGRHAGQPWKGARVDRTDRAELYVLTVEGE
jgi:hypothetical protein